jgi:S-formylglutathione hydrolase FrmB
VQVIDLPAADAPGGERKVWVYRPGLLDTTSLPVVYFLHGLPGSYRDIAAIGGRQMLDRLVTTGAVAPFVLAVPDGNSSRAADPEWADSALGHQRLEQFVTKTLPAAVEGTHPRPRSRRFLVGFSMGGYGAMNIALHHPDLYGAVSSLAGYFDTDDESGVFNGDAAVIAANRPDLHVDAARTLRVMLADGSGDTEAVTRGETTRFARLLRAHGVRPFVDITPGSHNSAYLRSELPRALAFLVNGAV